MLRSISLFTLLALSWASPIEKRSVTGPVILSNFPDPSFIEVDGTYYAFATADSTGIPMATSKDFRHWTVSKKPALNDAGHWSNGQNVWAPDVTKIGDKYVMYYCALPTNGGKHCLGVATSTHPAGPYEPSKDALICDQSGGGVIDPFGFTDEDGSNWVIYKVDGNSLNGPGVCEDGGPDCHPTPIMAQRMSADGLSRAKSAPVKLIDRSQADGALVEAPAILRVPNGKSATYFLFFSSHYYNTGEYDTKYAVSHHGLLGPWEKVGTILSTGNPNARLYGPGGTSTGVKGSNKIVFHADQGTTDAVRQMWTGELRWDASKGTVTAA